MQSYNLINLVKNPAYAEELVLEHAFLYAEPFEVHVDLSRIDPSFSKWVYQNYRTKQSGYVSATTGSVLLHEKFLVYMLYSMVPYITKNAYYDGFEHTTNVYYSGQQTYYKNIGVPAYITVFEQNAYKENSLVMLGYLIEPFENMFIVDKACNKRTEIYKKILAAM